MRRYFEWLTSRIRNKLLVSLLVLALVPLTAVGYFALRTGQESLSQRAFDQLGAVSSLQKESLNDLFREYQSNVLTIAADPDIVTRVSQEVSLDTLDAAEAQRIFKEYINAVDEVVTDPDVITRVMQLAELDNLKREDAELLFKEYTAAVDELATDPELISRLGQLASGVKADLKQPLTGADKDKLLQDVTQRLRSRVKNLAAVQNAHVCDEAGVVVADTQPDGRQLGQTKATDAYFTGAKAEKGKVFIKPFYKSTTGQNTVAVSMTMNDSRGKLLGVVVLRMDGAAILKKAQDELTVRLRQRIKHVPFVVNAHICEADKGEVVADTLPAGKNQLTQIKATDAYFTGAVATPGKPFVKPFYKSSTGAQSVAVSQTINDPKGKVIAVAVLRLDGDAILRNLRQELTVRLREAVKNIPGVVNGHICDPNGVIIADSLAEGKSQVGQNKATDAYFTGAKDSKGKVYVKPVYLSTTGIPSTAASTTIVDARGKLQGVMVIRLSTSEMSRILSSRAGMGATGESYLVNPAKLMATSTHLSPDSVLKQQVDTEGARRGLTGESGQAIYTDFRGSRVLGHYEWVPEWKMALLSEIDESEALAAVTTLRWTIIAVVLGSAILVILAAIWLARGITKQVDAISSVFSQIGMGNFAARADVVSSDELGMAATSLNGMLDNTMSLIQSQDEKEQIQQSISKLLVEVSGVADGDLTKEAEVTTDMTGAIADSFNYMIEQLRKVISDVQDSTVQVSSSANEIHATAEHLATGTEAQAEQIVNTSAAIDEMAVSIQQVSENAALSTNVAQQALQNAKQGTEAVYNTIDGMNRIRDQVQETAKRIKRLGESSQEIGQIIQLIDDIADRTSILALNASIQAAMAGDAGRGFAVVAEEVERLAVRSTDATKKIATLVKTIQSETGEAVNAMEKGIKEVVDGSRLANQAGKSLTEIEGVSKQLAELIQSISLASKQQARGSEALAKSMGEISQITQQTAAGTKQAAVSVNGLASLADELRSSVSTFKLPGRSNHANGGPAPNGKTNGHANGKDGKDGKRMLPALPAGKLART